jgi:hypothetical protein
MPGINRSNRLERLGRFSRIAVMIDGNDCALRRETLRNGSTDAPRAAGYQRKTSVKSGR